MNELNLKIKELEVEIFNLKQKVFGAQKSVNKIKLEVETKVASEVDDKGKKKYANELERKVAAETLYSTQFLNYGVDLTLIESTNFIIDTKEIELRFLLREYKIKILEFQAKNGIKE
jgi:hypothetical protein